MSRNLPADQRIRLVRGQLLQSAPLFGLLAMRLTLQEDTRCRDMWTDSVTLGYNPVYIDKLLDLELEGLLVHVTGHVLSGHPWRQSCREANLWNQACDYALNPILKQAGYRLPKGSLLSERYVNLPAEVVFEQLKAEKEAKQPKQPGASAPSEPGEGDDATGASAPGSSKPDEPGEPSEDNAAAGADSPPTEPAAMPGEVRAAPAHASGEDAQAEWRTAIEHAAAAQGYLPGGLQRLVKESAESRHDWREQLLGFAQRSYQAQEYSWSRPNRRYLSQGFYMPSRAGKRMPPLVVVRDTSGSVGGHYLAVFNAAIEAIIDAHAPEAVWVVDCDAYVAQVMELSSAELPTDWQAKGGGGTRFEPAFEWVTQQGLEPACVIYFTDLNGSFPRTAPDYPVLWAVPKGPRGPDAPFGETITLELN